MLVWRGQCVLQSVSARLLCCRLSTDAVRTAGHLSSLSHKAVIRPHTIAAVAAAGCSTSCPGWPKLARPVDPPTAGHVTGTACGRQ